MVFSCASRIKIVQYIVQFMYELQTTYIAPYMYERAWSAAETFSTRALFCHGIWHLQFIFENVPTQNHTRYTLWIYIFVLYIFSCPTEFSCILVILFSVSFTFCTFLSYPNREPVKCTYVYVCVIYTERCIPYASFSFSEIKWNE